jgi:hypothetical protein
VPLIIKPPQGRKIAANVRTEQISLRSNADFLGVLKIPVPPKVQGKNLAENLTAGGPLKEVRYIRDLSATHSFQLERIARPHVPGFHFIDGPKAELYDLSHDPGELKNHVENKA